MPNFCSAFGCSNSSAKESCRKKGISFHKFPLTDKILTHQWVVNIRRADFEPTPYSYICSDHFTEENFEYQPFTNRRGLKKGAIPTRFSFNSYKSSHRKKKNLSQMNQNYEMYGENNVNEPELIGNDTESKEVQMDTYALVEIYMNERFYLPEQVNAVSNGLPESSKPKRKSKEKIVSLKESLHAKILLRSLKKQLLDAEIKAANAKRDYYEAKKAMLSQFEGSLDSDDSSDSEIDPLLMNIKNRLKEEELAAQIEERMLQEQLDAVQMDATNYENDYHDAKSIMLSYS